MNSAQIIAIIVGLATLILAVAVQGGAFAFMLGKQSQRLSTVEKDTEALKAKSDAQAATLGELVGMKGLMVEVRKDVKFLLRGPNALPRRETEE